MYSSEVGAPTFIPTPITSILPTPASPNAAVANGGGNTGGGNSSACDTGCIIGVVVSIGCALLGAFVSYHIFCLQSRRGSEFEFADVRHVAVRDRTVRV